MDLPKKKPFASLNMIVRFIFNDVMGKEMANKANSLAHTKYRRKIIYNQYRASIQEII